MTVEQFPLVWDSTMRSAFASCPKKFWWEFVRKLGPCATSIHLHFGAAFARGIEITRRAYYDGQHDMETSMALGMEALIVEYGNFEDISGAAKHFGSCVEALVEYFLHHMPLSDPIQPYRDSSGKAAVEFTFALPIHEVRHPVTGEELIYAGRFDMLGVYNGSLYVVDEKTTSQLGASFYKQWDLRGQLTGYVWGASQYGLPVAGAIVRGVAIKKSGIDIANPVIAQRPQWLVEAWYKQLVRDLQRAVRCFEEGYWDVDFDSSCTAYGGCQYVRLCTTNEPERWIDGYFVERNWNPLAKDPLAA